MNRPSARTFAARKDRACAPEVGASVVAPGMGAEDVCFRDGDEAELTRPRASACVSPSRGLHPCLLRLPPRPQFALGLVPQRSCLKSSLDLELTGDKAAPVDIRTTPASIGLNEKARRTESRENENGVVDGHTERVSDRRSRQGSGGRLSKDVPSVEPKSGGEGEEIVCSVS